MTTKRKKKPRVPEHRARARRPAASSAGKRAGRCAPRKRDDPYDDAVLDEPAAA